MLGTSQNCSLNYCIVEYANTGIPIVSGASNHTLNGCIVRKSGSCGMYLLHAHHINIFRTSVVENGNTGIVIDTSDYITLDKRCFICNNGGDGIDISITYPTIHNTVISNNAGSGVVLSDNTTLIDMQNCEIRENHQWGINWGNKANGTVSYSNIIGNDYNGIIVSQGASCTANYNNIYFNGALGNSEVLISTEGLYMSQTVPAHTSNIRSNYWYAPLMIKKMHFQGGTAATNWSGYDVYDEKDCRRFSTATSNVDTLVTFTPDFPYALQTEMSNGIGSSLAMWVNVPEVSCWLEDDQLTCTDTSGVVGARYNWWGQITSVDTLIYQRVNGTVDYSGFQTSYISNAGISNQLPVANAGPNQDSINIGTLVTLNGSGSFDPDTDLIYYHWAQALTNPIHLALSDFTVSCPTFTTDRGGEYVFILTVNDGMGTSTQIQ